MTERPAPGIERTDLTPIVVPDGGTWSPEIEGDRTGEPLPPLPDDAYPPGATPLPGD